MGKIPPRRKGSKLMAELSESGKRAEADFYRCPSGHGLPHRTAKGNCTPLHCTGKGSPEPRATDLARAQRAGGRGPASPGATRSPETAGEPPSRALVKAEDEEVKETSRLERARRREQARRTMVALPGGLRGGDAEAWTAQKLVELSPLAAAEMEFQLRFGDDEQRKQAAARILDSTGHGKKDLATGGATIIINASGGINLPWRQAPKEVAGETKVVEVRPIGSLQEGKKEPVR